MGVLRDGYWYISREILTVERWLGGNAADGTPGGCQKAQVRSLGGAVMSTDDRPAQGIERAKLSK